MSQSLKLSYKIYLEAEDIKQSRIGACASFLRNLFDNCGNTYFKNVEIDNESDMDDFSLRLYVDHTVEEEVCSNEEDAKGFILDFAEFVDKIAAAQSYMDLEGSFTYEYDGEKNAYRFISESGKDFCDFEEQ